MVIIFGKSTYGKTERLPGLFHVLTEFFHLYYFPLIPVGSMVVLEGTGGKRATKINPSWRSVLIAYLRAVSVAAGVVLTIWSVIDIAELFKNGGGIIFDWGLPVLALLAWMIFALSYRWSKPSPARALVLANMLDIPLEHLIEHYLNDPRVEQMMQQRQLEAIEAPPSSQGK